MFEILKTYTCRVCGRNYILEYNAFNCCPHAGNNWSYGKRSRAPFKCRSCGKTFDANNRNMPEVEEAAFFAFVCCASPENELYRTLTEDQREIISKPRFSLHGGPYRGPSGLELIGRAVLRNGLGISSTLRRGDPCPDCRGTGRINGVMCDRCAGTGKLLV